MNGHKPLQRFTVERFVATRAEEMGLRLLAGKAGLTKAIREASVNRPGLMLAGFSRYFAEHRVQVIGNAEVTYLESLPPEERAQRYTAFFGTKIPCVVFCRGHEPDADFLARAEQAEVPIFRCGLNTMRFINLATLVLQELSAPTKKVLGSMVDILGIGVLITGAPGIGKSECAVGLIERGYSLVADDLTELRLTAARELIGTAPVLGRNFMEVRGIGLVNVLAMFGVKGVRTEKRLDLVVRLQRWEPGDAANIERVGEELAAYEIFGIKVPQVTIPVCPGRDIARLVEVAAFHMKLRIQGYNPAADINGQLINAMQRQQPPPPPPAESPQTPPPPPPRDGSAPA
jgi:HPr kinase/phosphorylase